MVAGVGYGRLYLWDVAGGEQLRAFAGHIAFIHRLAFSLDGRLFLSNSDDGQLILWEADTGDTRFVYTNPTDVITSLAFSPDGRLFVASAGFTRYVANFDPTEERDTRIFLWKTETGAELSQLASHTGPVTAIAFSPDGRFLLSEGLDAALLLWEVESGSLVRRLDSHSGGISAVVFSADGAYAASVAQDGTLIVWDMDGGDLLRQIQAHREVLLHLAFTSGGEGLWSAAQDGGIHLWRMALETADLPAWIAAHRQPLPITAPQQAQLKSITLTTLDP